MIANTIFAAGAFASLVAAIPMAQVQHQKRDVVWETHTEVAVTTIPVTVTHWLEPGESAPTDAAVGKQHWGHQGHGHGHGGHGSYGSPAAQPETTETVAPAAPETTPQAPAPSSYEQPTSQAPAPSSDQPTSQAAPPPAYTSPAAPAAPTTTQTPAPAPTSTWEAPSAPAYTPEPQTSAAPAPQPSQPSGGSGSGSGSGSGQEYTGDITHYDVGLGSCGKTHTDSEMVVAIPEGMMNNPANPNLNPLCGQTITIQYDGQDHTAEIVDTCGGCYATSIDLSPTLFKAVAPNGDGRVHDVKWWFNN